MSETQTALEAAPPHAVYLWPGQTHFGVGVAERAGSEAAALSATHVLLLADPGVLALAQPVIDALVGAGLTYTLHSEVAPNPSVESVDQAAAVYRAHGCDLIVALGGGSAIDTAKGVRMLAAAPGASIFDFSYLRANPRPTPGAHALPPLIAIPTTAGTGAEVTPWGVITHTPSKRKFGIGGPTVTPTVALVDPAMTYGLPPALTAATGADALSHLVEAYVSTNEAPLLDGMILHGVALIGRSLARATQNGRDAAARADVMLGALIGGIAISTRWLGACHSLAHPLSGISGVAHGVANALLLPHVVDFNSSGAPGSGAPGSASGGAPDSERTRYRYAQIAAALGAAPGTSAGDAIRALWAATGALPASLSAAGVREDQFPALAAAAMQDLNHTTNCRPCTEADMVALYRAAY